MFFYSYYRDKSLLPFELHRTTQLAMRKVMEMGGANTGLAMMWSRQCSMWRPIDWRSRWHLKMAQQFIWIIQNSHSFLCHLRSLRHWLISSKVCIARCFFLMFIADIQTVVKQFLGCRVGMDETNILNNTKTFKG